MSLDSSQYLRKMYDQNSQRARWLLIGLIALSLLVPRVNRGAIFALLIVAVLYNVLRILPSVKQRDVLGSKWLTIGINFSFITSLVLLSGGLSSPYNCLFIIAVLAASFWYGYTGLAYMAALLIVLWSALLFVHPDYHLAYLIFGAFTLILGDYGVQIGRLTRQEQERVSRDSGALREQKAKLFGLVNGLAQAIFVVDRGGSVTVYNGAALELLDTHHEIDNLPVAETVRLSTQAGKEIFPVQDVLANGQPFSSSELQLRIGDSSKLDVYTSVTPIVEAGERVGALLLLRDITEQKTLEGQKDEFISIISHELRTPVAIVEADLSTLMLPKFAVLPEDASKLLTNAYQNLTFLASLLKDLSNLASSERSLLDTELGQLDAVKLTAALVEGMHDKAHEGGVELKVSHSSQLLQVITSSQRVEEILVNFLTNAIKYSGQKGKLVELKIAPSIELKGGLKFSVTDHGIGMAKADQKQLFTKFFRSQNPQAQAIKGTGMGLYVCKKQADKIGARISFTSMLGHGTTFQLDVPAKISAD